MPTADDLEQDATEVSAETSVATPAKPSPAAKQDGVDYFKKYTGLNSAHSKLLAEKSALEAKLGEAEATAADWEVKFQNATKPYEKQVKDIEKEKNEVLAKFSALEAQVNADKARLSLKSTLTERFKDNPAVVEAWEKGDLKDRTTFATGEEGDKAFGEYMDRMATLLKPAAAPPPPPPPADQQRAEDKEIPSQDRRTFLSGATPQPSRPYRQDSNPSVDQIRKQIEGLDRKAPDYRKEFNRLTDEMDKALG